MLSVYKASAGSGKTYQLAYRYIKLLLGRKGADGIYRLAPPDNDNQRHIMAVTFTNKATEEMKVRIIHELAVLAGLERGWTRRSDYADRLMQELHCSEPELKEAAANGFRKLLFDYNYFQISTIDAFFQGILRTFAHDLDLSGDYEVDLDSKVVIAGAVRRLFDSLRTGDVADRDRHDGLVDWIWQYLYSNLSRGTTTNLFNRNADGYKSIVALISELTNEKFVEHHDAMMRFIRDGRHTAFLESLDDKARTIVAHIGEECRRVCGIIDSRGYAQSVKKTLLDIITKLAAGELIKDPRSKTLLNTLDDVTTAYKASAKGINLINTPDDELDGAIMTAVNDITTLMPQLQLFEQIKRNFFVVGIMERVQEFIEESTADDNTMLLGDATGMLKNIITEDSVPFVFDRIGVILNHFLIDEFQDTSRLQWENLRYLLREGQAEGHDSLIIGDEKQSIYRFRFSDATILQHRVQEEFGEQARIEGESPEENTNWRSTPKVVKFNNELFASIARRYGLDDVYHNVEQRVAPKNQDKGGYVSVLELDADDDTYGALALERMLDNMIREVRSGYRGCDMAVLTRERRQAAVVIDFLMKKLPEVEELRHLRVVSDDSMYVHISPAVRIILSVMRYYALMDTAASEEELNSKLLKRRRQIMSMINRYNYIYGNKGDSGASLVEALMSGDDIAADNKLIKDMSVYGVTSLVERIIEKYIPAAVAESQNMFIAAFQDVVVDYFSRGSGDLHTFLKWWDSTGYKSQVASAEDADAIRVMTIHKAKGLEYKCVHIPFGTWTMVKFFSQEWFDTGCLVDLGFDRGSIPELVPLLPSKYMSDTVFAPQYEQRVKEQMLDETNLLYVAFTRAVDELVVTYRKDGGQTTAAVLTEVLPALGEIDVCDSGKWSDSADSAVLREGGAPHAVSSEEDNAHQALDPSEVCDMPAYVTSSHDGLWSGIEIDPEEMRSEAVERGIALHAVMQRVRYPHQLAKAVERQVRRGAIKPEDKELVQSMLERELSREEVQRWFTADVAVDIERTILHREKGNMRMDRVVRYPDGSADVIDYKTGDEYDDNISQIHRYMDDLRQCGYSPVRGFLWYLDKGVIRQLS
ncbi:MAG: UvrD-helicase domain-containing protein [Paramuribaculum sp.]|nr:UvrD-helicase domain-containing protein [Paramuribaculum sp.]